MLSRVYLFFKKIPLSMYVILLILILLGLAIMLTIGKSNVSNEYSRDIFVVQEKAIEQTVFGTGRVYTKEKEMIYSLVNGSINKINVELGKKVSSGEILMELDIPEGRQQLYQAELELKNAELNFKKMILGDKTIDLINSETKYKEAESELIKAKQECERIKQLFEIGATSLKELEDSQDLVRARENHYQIAQAELNIAQQASSLLKDSLQATIEHAKVNLEMVQRRVSQEGIKSSMSGNILAIYVGQGDIVNAYQPLLSIGDLRGIYIKADISELDANKIRNGQVVNIYLSGYQNKKYTGIVTEIGLEAIDSIKQQTKTTIVPISISITDENPIELKPGCNVEVEVVTYSNQKAVVIPVTAVSNEKGYSYVTLIKDNGTNKHKIETGRICGEYIEVVSGLEPGDTIMLEPLLNTR